MRTHDRQPLIFATRAGTRLATRVCRILPHLETASHKAGIDGPPPISASSRARCAPHPLAPSKTTDFSDTELKTEIGCSVRGKDCFLIHSPIQTHDALIAAPRAIPEKADSSTARDVIANTFESLIHIEALREAKARSITLISPYLAFSRQDHIRTREGVNTDLLARFYKAAGLDTIISFDLHSPKIVDFFQKAGIMAENCTATDLFLDRLITDYGPFIPGKKDQKGFCVAVPDAGGAARGTEFARKLGIPLMLSTKSRDHSTANRVRDITTAGDVKDKNVIIIDDMIDTAGTMAVFISKLKDQGAKTIIIIATHAIMSGPAIPLLRSLVKQGQVNRVYVTDSIIRSETFVEKNPWYREVSLSSSIAERIARIDAEPSQHA